MGRGKWAPLSTYLMILVSIILTDPACRGIHDLVDPGTPSHVVLSTLLG